MVEQWLVLNWVNEHYNGASYSGLSKFFGINESIIRKETEEFMGKYPRPEWAVRQILRMSGIVEDVSKKSCGHPNRGWLSIHDADGDHTHSVHGCTGECLNDTS